MVDAYEMPSGDDEDERSKMESLTDSPHHVTVEQAIRERIRLHPQARAQEIVAMMEMEGVQVAGELVERLKREAGGKPANPR